MPYLECGIIGHHDGCVEGENQDDPVPDGLEETVVEDDVRRCLGSLESVLGQHVRAQVHHLVVVETLQ